MQAHGAVPDKAKEEFLHQFGIKGSDFFRGDVQFIAQAASSRNVHRRQNQRLVHGKQEAAVAGDAPLIPQRGLKGLPKADADVLHTVVVVHMGVSIAGDK